MPNNFEVKYNFQRLEEILLIAYQSYDATENMTNTKFSSCQII